MTTDAAIVDLDGTVYRGGDPIAGAREGIETLRAAGVEVLFFSNNPTRPPGDYAARLTGMGIDADPEDVLTAGTVTAETLAGDHRDDAVWVLGEDGLRDQLDASLLVDDPTEADVVVASLDRGLTYEKLTNAYRALQSAYAFYGTDPDRTIPVGDREQVPGSGAVVAAVATAAERDPTILGKPSTNAAQAALDRLGVSAGECLVVGDRLDTDVAMAGEAGMRSALVLTGAHDESDLDWYGETPDYVFESLAGVKNVAG